MRRFVICLALLLTQIKELWLFSTVIIFQIYTNILLKILYQHILRFLNKLIFIC